MASMTAPLRWGILGASARIYTGRLFPAFEAATGNDIVATASRDGQDESPYDELLERHDVDAVYVPLPNAFHRPLDRTGARRRQARLVREAADHVGDRHRRRVRHGRVVRPGGDRGLHVAASSPRPA